MKNTNMSGKTPLELGYGQEMMIPMDYIVPSLYIAATTRMSNKGKIEEILAELVRLEESHFIVGREGST